MRIQRPTITQITQLKGDGAILTGSFSGSFTGEYNTDIVSSSAQIAALGAGIISSSTQIDTDLFDIDGLVSGSTQIGTDISGSLGANATLIRSLTAAGISGSSNASSASFSTRVTSNDTDIAGLNTYTGSLKTAISVTGANTTLLGNLTVQGTQTSLDTATLNVADLNILIASGAADAASANGAGLTVDGANATLLYGSSDNNWKFNKEVQAESGIKVTNVFEAGTDGDIFGSGDLSISNITVSGTVDGVDVANLKTDFDTLDGKTLVSGSSIASSAQGEVALTTNGVAASAVDLGLQTSDNVQFNSIGIGTAGSGTTGEIRATGDITAYYSSDERLKENFTPLAGALDKVKAIGGYEFDWKDGIEDVVSKTGHDIGVKAQELQAQYPELVHERDNGYLAVDYVKLNAVLIEAVKELAAKVEELSK